MNTVISYEGVYLDENMLVANPNVERIINVWGTAKWAESSFQDFGPPLLPNANFQGIQGNRIENINIQMLGAYHEDFTYLQSEWFSNPPTNDQERAREFINRRTNEFMRILYRHALEDQITPGDLELFLTTTPGISFDEFSETWVVNPYSLIVVP